jgi:hypothetical protein
LKEGKRTRHTTTQRGGKAGALVHAPTLPVTGTTGCPTDDGRVGRAGAAEEEWLQRFRRAELQCENSRPNRWRCRHQHVAGVR